MKKILSVLLITALMLSMFTVSAFAANGDEPAPDMGPATSFFMYGGARCGIYDTRTQKNKEVMGYDYDEGKLAVYNDAIPGMTYDLASNTLTVDNVHQRDNQLYIWYMGNDFKLNVVGENEFGIIYVYNYFNFHGTSLNIIGSGTLTVNEQKTNEQAIRLYADGLSPVMGLDIAESVTVNLYSKDADTSVVSLGKTVTTPAAGAITVGGTAIPEAQSEQVKVMDFDYVPVASISDLDNDVNNGLQVRSKSDPDGVYSVIISDGVLYIVRHWIYMDSIGMWINDPDFYDQGFAGKKYSKEEFEAAYEYVYGDAPTSIDYMTEYSLNWRGTEGSKMTKDGEPGAVYVGAPTGGVWDWGDEYTGNYEISRVVWDDNQEMYAADPDFEPIDLMAGELEENGFHIVKEDVFEPLYLTVWTSSDPDDSDRFDIMARTMDRKSDPDGLYVQIGRYGSNNYSEGVTVFKVHYNPETEEHYIEYHDYEEPECYYVSNESIENGTADFSYAGEMVSQHVKLRFLPKNYNIKSNLSTAIQLKKSSEPGAVYGYRSWTHFMEDDTEIEEYGIMKLRYHEGMGCYLEDTDFEEIVIYDLAQLAELGFEVVMSNQPLPYYTKGRLNLSEYPAYAGADGETYYADYNERVYSYSDDDTITLGDTTYYFGTYEPEVSVDDLISSEHEIVTDTYRYWIDGPEYHHAAGEQPDPVAYALWVNGEQVTSDHLTVTCGKGSATYEPAKNTLTLNNAEITKGAEKDGTYSGVLSQMDGLTVVVKGSCTITETNGDGIGTYNNESYEVGDVTYPAPYDLTICGDGTLTIVESDTLYGYGVYCTGDLVIDGVTLNITSGASGVWATSLDVRDTQADIHCTSRFSGFVVNRGDFNFENSTVSAVSDSGAGLLLGSDKTPSVLTVSSGELSLRGVLGVQGIVDSSVVTVNGGTLSVEGAESAFDESLLADGAKNIVMGEGIGVVSGAIDGKSVVISTAPSGGFTVSGGFTSYLDAEGTVTFELVQNDEVVYTAAAVGNTGSYAIENVAAGEYTLRVSKLNHVTRDEYTVKVTDADVTQDVKICPLGDISGDGKVTTKDYAMANAHAQKVTYQTGYALKCGDVLKSDGKITTADAARINAHAQKVNLLW